MLTLIWICAIRKRACGVATCSFYKLMKQFKIDPYLSCSSLTTCTPGSLLICCAYKKFQNINGSPTKSIHQADGFQPEALTDGCSLLTQRKQFVDGSCKWLVKIPDGWFRSDRRLTMNCTERAKAYSNDTIATMLKAKLLFLINIII